MRLPINYFYCSLYKYYEIIKYIYLSTNKRHKPLPSEGRQIYIVSEINVFFILKEGFDQVNINDKEFTTRTTKDTKPAPHT